MRSYAKSIALYERTKQTLAGGVSSNVRYAATPVPLFFDRGEGARLYDVDGNVHIDYVLGNGPAILGHAPKPVIEAVAATLRRRPGLCRAASARDRAGRAALPAAARRRGRALRHLRHRGGADGDSARPRLHRPRPRS